MELLDRARHGDLDEVKRLVEEECVDVDTKNEHNKTALYYACENGHAEVAQYLLDNGASVSLGEKPLVAAVTGKHVTLVQLLLTHGAHPDALEESVKYSSRQKLPLHIAADDCNTELVELLLKHGANVDITEYTGHTALHNAVNDHLGAASALSWYTADTKNLKAVIDILLENKADVNIVNNYGKTPLYIAAKRGLLDIVRKMLEVCGGNPNRGSSLVVACQRQNVELANVLLMHGADPNIESETESRYDIPLFIAVDNDNKEMIKSLLNAGASVNAVNYEGINPVCLAAGEIISIDNNRSNYSHSRDGDRLTEKLSTIRLLLQHGAHFSFPMQDGESPLISIVDGLCSLAQPRGLRYRSTVELLQLMIQHGAVLLDSSPELEDDIHNQWRTVGTLRSLATFDGKCKFIVDMLRAGAGFQLIKSCCDAVSTASTAKSIRLCQAAVLAGYAPRALELQQLQLAAARSDTVDQLVNWLNEDRQHPPSLLRQCRVVIRRQLSAAVHYQTILPAIDKLPLPKDLKLYLQFDGVMSEVDLSASEERQTCETDTSEEGSTDNSGSGYHMLDFEDAECVDPFYDIFCVSDSDDSYIDSDIDNENDSDDDNDSDCDNDIDNENYIDIDNENDNDRVNENDGDIDSENDNDCEIDNDGDNDNDGDSDSDSEC